MTRQETWGLFAGGELEGPRPRLRCAACRAQRSTSQRASAGTLCFECYRAQLNRERALRRAVAEDPSAEGRRFSESGHHAPVQVGRLLQLKAVRQRARDAEARRREGGFAERRRRAQRAARRAVAAAPFAGVEAAELQLPAAWLPFVLSR
jgi:hypothetical protein